MHEDGKKVVIGVSVATTLVTIVVILVSLVIVTFLVWRHLKKSRYYNVELLYVIHATKCMPTRGRHFAI